MDRARRGKHGSAVRWDWHTIDGIELELLEPGEGSDFYRQTIDPQGRPVIQHIGFLTHKVDEWADKISKWDARYGCGDGSASGPLSIDFAYMDTVQ